MKLQMFPRILECSQGPSKNPIYLPMFQKIYNCSQWSPEAFRDLQMFPRIWKYSQGILDWTQRSAKDLEILPVISKNSQHLQILPGISKSSYGSPYVPSGSSNFPKFFQIFPGTPRFTHGDPRVSSSASRDLQMLLGDLEMLLEILWCFQGSSYVRRDPQKLLEIFRYPQRSSDAFFDLQMFPVDDIEVYCPWRTAW